MAKLIACMLLTGWLIVMLAVNVRSDGWFSNVRAWKCIGELASDKVDVGKWIKNMIFANEKFNCYDNELFRSLIHNQVDGRFSLTRKFMNEYLEHYLNECGMEERFKLLIDKIKQRLDWQWPPENKRTLYSYLKRPAEWLPYDVSQLLRALRDDLNFDRDGKIDCTDHNNRYFKFMLEESGHFKDLNALVDAYYKLWLNDCDYEGRFQQALGNLNELPYAHWDSVSYPTLHKYQRKYRSVGPVTVIEALTSICELFKPNPITGEINCTPENQTNLLKLFSESRYEEHYFEDFVKNYVQLYFDKCGVEDDFKKVTNYIRPFSEQSWDFSKFSTLYSYARRYGSHPDGPVSVIRELSGLVSRLGEADCTNELISSLLQLLEKGKLYENLRSLLIAYLASYLKGCGFEARLEKTIESIAQVWPKMTHEPKSYPTLTSHLRTSCNTKEPMQDCVKYGVHPIGVMLKFEDFSKQTHCNDKLISDLVKEMSVLHKLGEFKSFVLDLFAFYLDECGLEQSFRKTFAIIESPNEPTLFKYLSSDPSGFEESWQKLVMSIISELSKPASTQSGPDCSQELIKSFSTILDRAKLVRFKEWYPTLGSHLANYKSKCGKQS